MPNNCITIWKDGTWKAWGGVDAHYAQADPNYLLTIPMKDIVSAMSRPDGVPAPGPDKES